MLYIERITIEDEDRYGLILLDYEISVYTFTVYNTETKKSTIYYGKEILNLGKINGLVLIYSEYHFFVYTREMIVLNNLLEYREFIGSIGTGVRLFGKDMTFVKMNKDCRKATSCYPTHTLAQIVYSHINNLKDDGNFYLDVNIMLNLNCVEVTKRDVRITFNETTYIYDISDYEKFCSIINKMKLLYAKKSFMG